MFLQIVGHAHTMRIIGEDFQHSIEIVWRCFRNVLRCVLRMKSDYMKMSNANTPIHHKVSEGTSFAPFKDALGAIDGTHIPAYPDSKDKFPERFHNRKGVPSQNVMAAVDFDGFFVSVVTGWEGSAHDNLILRTAVEDGFTVPQGKYFLVDGGYANTNQFLAPYRATTYHLASFRARRRGANQVYGSPEELFNYKHAQLRNIVEKTFGILKSRFKICVNMRRYKFRIQKKVVKACCILHNFIKHQNRLQNLSDDDLLYQGIQNNTENENEEDIGVGGTLFSNGDALRESIKNILWNNR
ncbi:nuclease [Rhynchospora pubera]|uniref:Nuclease n=1 Tax=Rhynchospora pubera TaxID=906938 RepID=A0AAV8EM47_9POAL|nr:nuclease [Rhynchospora pubera]